MHRIWDYTLGQRQPNLFLVAPSPDLRLLFTIPNNRCQKSWSIHIQRRWKRLYQTITVQLTNLLQLLCPVLLPKLAKGTLSRPNHVVQFFFPWCQFSNSVQIKIFSTKCHDDLPYGEELWRLTLPSSPPQAFSLTRPRGIEGSVLQSVLDVIMDNLE